MIVTLCCELTLMISIVWARQYPARSLIPSSRLDNAQNATPSVFERKTSTQSRPVIVSSLIMAANNDKTNTGSYTFSSASLPSASSPPTGAILRRSGKATQLARTRAESRDVIPSKARLEGEPDGDQCRRIEEVEMCRMDSKVRHIPSTRRSESAMVPL